MMFWKKKQNHSVVHDVQIASPCKADWNQMEGDERTRYCGMCKLNVYNISEMTTEEAEKLLSDTTGRVCTRLFRRKDGTVLTKDCPVGLRAVRLKLATMYGAGLAAVSVALAFVLNKPVAQGRCGTSEMGGATVGSIMPMNVEMGKMKVAPPPPTGEVPVNGGVPTHYYQNHPEAESSASAAR